MRILLLSAYDAHSHRRWRQGLAAAFPGHDWTTLTLPPRHFNWRIRGNSLSWAFGEREMLGRHYDLMIATSMVDVSALKGMVPSLAAVPCLVYCHENQFAYPPGHQEPLRIEPQMVNLYTLLAADRAVFNSAYNRDTFMAGVRGMLRRMPDAVPPGVAEHVLARSCVLPVPLESRWFDEQHPSKDRHGPLTIVWNHRWEYDKAPERMFMALAKLQAAGVDFRLHVIGQQFRQQPAVFAEMRPLLEKRILTWGTVESPAKYRCLLAQSHVALSTSLHEFQGLAVLEAVASGCLPLVPDRLAYPEYFASAFRYPSFPDDPEQESEGVTVRLQKLAVLQRQGGLPPSPDVSGLSWLQLKSAYAGEILRLSRGR